MADLGRQGARFAGALLSLLLLFALSSCLGIGMETAFNADGSGQVRMTFRISYALIDMGSDGGEVDVPLSREDLEEAFAGVSGVTVREVTEEETEEDRIITAVIAFADFNALAGTEGFPAEGASLRREGNRTYYQMNVGKAKAVPSPQESAEGESEDDLEDFSMDEAMTEMVQAFMEGYFVDYRVTAPSRIVRHSHGELSADGRTVTFSMGMGDYFVLEEPFVLEVVW